MQLEMFLRMRQRIMRHQRSNVRQFGRLRLQELFPRRSIKERSRIVIEVPSGQARFFHPRHLAAVDLDHRASGVFLGSRFKVQARNRCNRGQCLAPKAEGCNAQQIVRVSDLRGRMPLECQHGIVAHHAAAIVDDLDQLLPARFDVDANAAGARIERVLKQLFHHRCRTLHHLARGDLVGNAFR